MVISQLNSSFFKLLTKIAAKELGRRDLTFHDEKYSILSFIHGKNGHQTLVRKTGCGYGCCWNNRFA